MYIYVLVYKVYICIFGWEQNQTQRNRSNSIFFFFFIVYKASDKNIWGDKRNTKQIKKFVHKIKCRLKHISKKQKKKMKLIFTTLDMHA